MKKTKAISILGAAAAAAFATSAEAAVTKVSLTTGVTQVDWATGYQDLHAYPGGPGWLGKGGATHRRHR